MPVVEQSKWGQVDRKPVDSFPCLKTHAAFDEVIGILLMGGCQVWGYTVHTSLFLPKLHFLASRHATEVVK